MAGFGRRRVTMSLENRDDGVWGSSLSEDILFLVLKRLPQLHDRLSFRAVCKSWFSAHKEWLKTQPPWTMFYVHDQRMGRFPLRFTVSPSRYVPESRNTLYAQIQPSSLHHRHQACDKDEPKIIGSKGRWFLLQQKDGSFYCFNFLTSTIRAKIPKLKNSNNRAVSCTYRAGFSADPTSSDCVIFVIKSDETANSVVVATYCVGDSRFYEDIFNMNGTGKCEDVVYKDGKFFCVFRGGVMGVFCLSDNHWSFMFTPLPCYLFPEALSLHMVHQRGDCFLVIFRDYAFHLFKLDWEKLAWVQQQELGNCSIFLNKGKNSLLYNGSSSGDDPLVNKIFRYSDHYAWSYCCKKDRHSICHSYPSKQERELNQVWIEPLF